MTFNSHIFLIYFLPLTITVWFILGKCKDKRYAKMFLFIASLLFYGYADILYIPLILLNIGINYFFHVKLVTKRENKKTIWILGLVLNIGLLFWLKYYDFLVENVNHIFGTNFKMNQVMLVLAVSFYTFQQIALLYDSYKGVISKYDLLDYAVFVAYFPKLISGPIALHTELIPQFNNEKSYKISYENLFKGLYYLAVGLGKKVLLADSLSKIVVYGYENISILGTVQAMLVILAYTLQIYFDFSGYSDMARGVSLMLNIELPVNFFSPYRSTSISEFWDRWHMTLTRFLTRYLYIPLGGSRKGIVRTCINILIVFSISGLWHGSNWTFVVWGLMHGALMVLDRFRKMLFKGQGNVFLKVIGWLFTFLFVSVAWVFFRADSIADATALLSQLTNWTGITVTDELFGITYRTSCSFIYQILLQNRIWEADFRKIVFVVYYIVSLGIVFFTPNIDEQMKNFKPTFYKALVIVVLFMCALVSVSTVSTFIYSGF